MTQLVAKRDKNHERTQAQLLVLARVDKLNEEAETRYRTKLSIQTALTRSLVSFQANKHRAVYRWFKYKEAFSADLVQYFISNQPESKGRLLDPFAGIGTALFAAADLGWDAEGIELLPIGQRVIATKQMIESGLEPGEIQRLVHWRDEAPWRRSKKAVAVNELRITRGAYPAATLVAVERFQAESAGETDRVQVLLQFALLCVLESVSFTRKDGQYLRWDHRSGRGVGTKAFDKGHIAAFDSAIRAKLGEMVADLRGADHPQDLFGKAESSGSVKLHPGSCLELLPRMNADSCDCIITSPPYCNRYDYTRTYALELALLGVDEAGLIGLRQSMLSCTVENRAKDLVSLNANWKPAIAATDHHELLQTILTYLESLKESDLLNNNGIPRMVRGYFYEMAAVVFECQRVLKPGGRLFMVNDNVRYAGASISVDLILSDIAERLGFIAEKILVLPTGKGNSSQQMGSHGRDPLRKCVYVWRKT